MSPEATPTDPITFAAGISAHLDPTQACNEALAQVTASLKGQPAHAAFLFVSGLYRAEWTPLLRRIRKELGNPLLLGCTAGGVLAAGQELERTPAVSLGAARLPRVKLHPFSVSPAELEERPETGFWIEKTGVNPKEEPSGILLPDPYSCDAMSLVAALNGVYPKMPLIGGLASGAAEAGGNALFLNDEIRSEGAVGALMTGDVVLQTVVSQGCRPIGRPYVITKSEENVIFELAGQPALDALQALYVELSEGDKKLAREALLLGVVMNEYQQTFRRGDFLIRNLIGMDPTAGALAVGDRIQTGQTVQFHVRDAAASREDMQTLLKENVQPGPGAPGGLLFSCLGRGRELYGEPNMDVRMIRDAIGPCPIAGFFCNGEIGPIGAHNYIHGFTASLGLFRSRSEKGSR